jgi:hypothetical protein
MSQAQRFLADVVCQATAVSQPRLGLARPRDDTVDPAGGYLAVPVDYDYPGLEAAIASLECQEHIAVVLADDAPSRDDFDSAFGGGEDFGDLPFLIGNYNPDDAYPEAGLEEPPGSPTCPSGCEVALYLDDIALFMHETDFHPGFAGVQRFRTFTVGFSPEPFGMALLEKTAQVGGGLFLTPADADTLRSQGAFPQSHECGPGGGWC